MSATSSVARAHVALGANLGRRRGQLARGLVLLERTPGVSVVACSPWYGTAAVGGPAGQPDYLNGAAELAVRLTPGELLARMLEVERSVGRDRRLEPRNGPRVLDLDLLLFDDLRIDEPRLVVPHPRLEERTFVLAPLAAIAPDLVLPSGATVAERLDALVAAGEERPSPVGPSYVGARP